MTSGADRICRRCGAAMIGVPGYGTICAPCLDAAKQASVPALTERTTSGLAFGIVINAENDPFYHAIPAALKWTVEGMATRSDAELATVEAGAARTIADHPDHAVIVRAAHAVIDAAEIVRVYRAAGSEWFRR